MTKYLIDASIIASSIEDFKRRFINSESILVLSDLSFRELEARKKDKDCELESKGFTRFLIDLFVRDTSSTEICLIEEGSHSNHIDEKLVEYAKTNNMSILTCDKGMALWCRFYNVNCVLLETRTISKLPFIFENNNSVYLNLFDGSIPKSNSVYVYSPIKNSIISPLENGLIFLNPGYVILVAHPQNGLCGIDSYYVNKDRNISLIGKDIYSSEEDIDDNDKPFHKNLFNKWTRYMSKS